MRGRTPLIVGIVVIVLGILIYLSSFIVRQTEQAVVLQFGDPQRVITEPGLHFKLPFVQNVRYLEKRVLNLDPTSQTVLLEDNRRLVVDAFVRYRISKPLVFIRSVGTEAILDGRLSPVVNDAVRGVFGEATLTDVVSARRAGLMTEIRDRVNTSAERFGIDIVDLRIGRADLAPQVAEAVYDRMRAERQRLAADFRARGQEQYQTITSQADREATVIRAEAQRKSDILRGEGEAQRASILNDAFSRDAEFFAFYRTMEAYRAALEPGSTSMVLTTDGDFFRYFNQARPGGGPLDPIVGDGTAAAGAAAGSDAGGASATITGDGEATLPPADTGEAEATEDTGTNATDTSN